MGLHQNRGLGGVNAARQIVQRHLHDVVPHLLGMVKVVGEGLCIGDHEEQLLKPAAVLQHHAVTQRTDVVADVEASGRAVACEDDLSHDDVSFLYEKYFETTKNVLSHGIPWDRT